MKFVFSVVVKYINDRDYKYQSFIPGLDINIVPDLKIFRKTHNLEFEKELSTDIIRLSNKSLKEIIINTDNECKEFSYSVLKAYKKQVSKIKETSKDKISSTSLIFDSSLGGFVIVIKKYKHIPIYDTIRVFEKNNLFPYEVLKISKKELTISIFNTLFKIVGDYTHISIENRTLSELLNDISESKLKNKKQRELLL